MQKSFLNTLFPFWLISLKSSAEWTVLQFMLHGVDWMNFQVPNFCPRGLCIMMNGFWTLPDVYSGDPSGDMVHQQRSLQPSPEHQKKTARRRTHDYDVWCWSVNGSFCLPQVKMSQDTKVQELYPMLMLPILYNTNLFVFLFYNITITVRVHTDLLIFSFSTSSQPSLCTQQPVWILDLKLGPATNSTAGDMTLTLVTSGTDQVRKNHLHKK